MTPRNLRVTPTPPATPAEWYTSTAPCKHCKGRLCYRAEDAEGNLASITVQHQAKCPALKE